MCYIGIGPERGIRVDEQEAFDYALVRCLHGTEEEKQDFRTMLKEWYYSGNWLKEEGHEIDY